MSDSSSVSTASTDVGHLRAPKVTQATKSDRWATLLTVAAAAGILLAVMAIMRTPPARRPKARAKKQMKDQWEDRMREMIQKDSLPAHEVTELIGLLKQYKLRLYVVPGCRACLLQKLLLTNFMEYVEVINCAKQGDVCRAANVRGVPMWVFPEGFSVRERVGSLSKKDLLLMLRRHKQTDLF